MDSEYISVTNTTKSHFGWGRYGIEGKSTERIPREIAETLRNDKRFIVHWNTISNNIIKDIIKNVNIETISNIPNVFIDCNNPTGGIASHIRSLKKFTRANFVSDISDADINHWHFGGGTGYNNVATCHGYYTDRFKHIHKEVATTINNVLKSAFDKTEFVIAVSNWVKEGLKEKLNIDSTVIRNGIDVTEFYNRGYKDYIFASAYDCIEKNPDAIFSVAKKMPDKEFVVIVGNGNRFPRLKNVTMLGYPQPHSTVKELMAGSRLLLMPSLQEAGPIIILEAFASEKGVVAYNTNGPNEIINSGVDGILCPQHDIDAMVSACEEIWTHAEQYGKAALESSYKFDWRFRAQEINPIYNKQTYPSVSVIVLAYKNNDTLQQTIDSVPSWAKIIVGDADGTHKDIADSNGCTYVKVSNVNPGKNRNECAQYVDTKYVTILDGDDWRFPGTLEYQLRYMESSPTIGATCGACYRSNVEQPLGLVENDTILPPSIFMEGNHVPHCSLVVRSELAKSIGYYDESLDYAEDYDFAWRLSKNTTLMKLPHILYYWRFNPTGRSRDPYQEKLWTQKVRNKNG